MPDQWGTHDKGDSLEYHDRLDLKLGSENYTDAKCGSLHLGTGQKTYCCHQCPTLKADILAEAGR